MVTRWTLIWSQQQLVHVMMRAPVAEPDAREHVEAMVRLQTMQQVRELCPAVRRGYDTLTCMELVANAACVIKDHVYVPGNFGLIESFVAKEHLDGGVAW